MEGSSFQLPQLQRTSRQLPYPPPIKPAGNSIPAIQHAEGADHHRFRILSAAVIIGSRQNPAITEALIIRNHPFSIITDRLIIKNPAFLIIRPWLVIDVPGNGIADTCIGAAESILAMADGNQSRDYRINEKGFPFPRRLIPSLAETAKPEMGHSPKSKAIS